MRGRHHQPDRGLEREAGGGTPPRWRDRGWGAPEGPPRRGAASAPRERTGGPSRETTAAHGTREGRGDRAREGQRGPRSALRGPAPEGRDHRGDVRLRQAKGAWSDPARPPDGGLRGRRRRSVRY